MIKGHTVSNLILSNYMDKNKNPIREIAGFAYPDNSRDVFININYKGKRPRTVWLYVNTIIHETTHNTLLKYISREADIQLDNLFYRKKNVNRILKKCYNLKPDETRKGMFFDFWLYKRGL
jgi:hypothetical protein